MKGMSTFALIVFAVVVISAGPSLAAGTYGIGFTWNRNDDWKPGTADYSSLGNPCTDSAGNPVWSAEYIQGVPAGSDLDTTDGVAPWYTLPATGLMVWDSHWGGGTWAMGYDNPPTAPRHAIAHIISNSSYHGDHYADVPLLRWVNPSAAPLIVSLTSGEGFQAQLDIGAPTGAIADYVIARTDASDGNSIHVLYSQTVVKSLDTAVRELFDLPELAVDNLQLDPGDNLLFAVRSRTSTTGDPWVDVALLDDVTITVVPEPATLALLGIGALGLLRRRKAARREL